MKVTRWFPGVLQAIVEEVKSKSSVSKTTTSTASSVKEILAREATKTLESKRNKAISATKEKSLDEIKKEMGIPVDSAAASAEQVAPVDFSEQAPTPPTTTRRRVRQKMRSTPVTGGSLFDGIKPTTTEESPGDAAADSRKSSSDNLIGQAAELVVNGEVFKIRVMPQTVHRIRSGYSGELLDDSSVKFSSKDVPIEHRLQGFVRTSQMGLETISEDDMTDSVSNHCSERDSTQGGGW